MNWLNEQGQWLFIGISIFMLAWFLVFLFRNKRAKFEQHKPDDVTKTSGSTPLKKSDKY